MIDIREHERLTKLTERQLFAEIGRVLLQESLGSTELIPEEETEAGKSWFEHLIPALRRQICNNDEISALFVSPTASARNTAIIGLIESQISHICAGVPVLTVAHATVCYSIHKLCNSDGETK